MADQWEALFRTLAEGTHAITEIIMNANEGDDLEAGYKVMGIFQTHHGATQRLMLDLGN